MSSIMSTPDPLDMAAALLGHGIISFGDGENNAVTAALAAILRDGPALQIHESQLECADDHGAVQVAAALRFFDESCRGYARYLNVDGRIKPSATDGARVVLASDAVFMGERRVYPVELPRLGEPDVMWTGHEGAREALARLVAYWRENLPALADSMERRGELASVTEIMPIYVQRCLDGCEEPTLAGFVEQIGHRVSSGDTRFGLLAECPALPMWIEAWLAADCPACSWTRRNWCHVCDGNGTAISPHIPAILARLRAMWQREMDDQKARERSAAP